MAGKSIPIEVVAEGGNSLYASERKVYPRDIDGRYQRLRKLAVFVLLGLFYGMPWLHWGGRQAVLFDLPARKFYVLGVVFWPQDFVFLAMLLMIAGFALFFFSALAGRLWCGYACPQTVWTEVFLRIEHWCEGDRAQRMRLDAAPWSAGKVWRKGSKHLLWLLLALWTGFTFVGFFTPIAELAARAPLHWSGWEAFWIFFYALATWGNAGFLREQVCKYMCPYARFQGAMFDRDTLIIAYDPMRGEPRGPRRRGLASVLERARGLLGVEQAYDYAARAAHASRLDAAGTTAIVDRAASVQPLPKFAAEELGDCIDCTICVQVCPTGIDIRNGLQYECIACGACIDACDDVMGKLGYPQGLIRHTTQNAVDGRPTRVVRPRMVVYALLLLAMLVGWGWGVSHRSPLIAEVLRDRNALYRALPNGGSENDYSLKIVNKSDRAQHYRITLRGDAGIALTTTSTEVAARAEEVLTVPLTAAAGAAVHGRHEVQFVVGARDGSASAVVKSTYFGPPP